MGWSWLLPYGSISAAGESCSLTNTCLATLVAVLFATNKIFVCAFSFRFLNDSVLSLQVVSIVDGWLMQPDTCKMS